MWCVVKITERHQTLNKYLRFGSPSDLNISHNQQYKKKLEIFSEEIGSEIVRKERLEG